MRDIKLRAWDKKKNDWFDDESGDLFIELNGYINFGWNGEIMEDYTDRIILMQYTGTKDKNGVDIYEGDYLSLIIFEANAEFKGEVVFSEGSFCVAIQIKGHDYKVPLHETTESDSLVEVLGNIWEDGDLIDS